jgi:hypothetical protein
MPDSKTPSFCKKLKGILPFLPVTTLALIAALQALALWLKIILSISKSPAWREVELVPTFEKKLKSTHF